MVLKIVKDKFPVPSDERLAQMREDHYVAKTGNLPRTGAALGPMVPIPDELLPPRARPFREHVDTFFFPTAKRADRTYFKPPEANDDKPF